ncbi:MAG TPA: putative Fe-S cluster assembly protein SufT, partial [Verrucomicrobiales bacterium]|nr:putative Fe-S cluster assembly protein SufT [Verrucomicrobiales bacterium]
MNAISLTRDCDVVLIPDGSPARLHEGTDVFITQQLGGTFTVSGPGGLYRIAGRDADALGLEAQPEPAPREFSGQPVTDEQVTEVLKTCFDPEIPVNIVDLGLVYDVQIAPGSQGGSVVHVQMTLTAQGCGMGGVIAGDAQQKILALDGV